MKKYLCDIKLWDSLVYIVFLLSGFMCFGYFLLWNERVNGTFVEVGTDVLEKCFNFTGTVFLVCCLFEIVFVIVRFRKWWKLRKEARAFTDSDDPDKMPFE